MNSGGAQLRFAIHASKMVLVHESQEVPLHKITE